MTDDFTSGMMALIRSALTAVPAALPENFNWPAAYQLADAHQILPLLYYGILNSNCTVPQDQLRLFKQSVITGAVLDQMQTAEFERISRAFETNGIDYMPLKGINLKPLYPDRSIRIMSDTDLLIRTGQYAEIVPVMQSLGYTQTVESNHEYVWRKSDALTVELHKRLIPSYNKDYCSYYGDGWQLAHPVKPKSPQYQLSKEDQFIYLLTHFAKHYRDGGIGIRHLVDLWVYKNANPAMKPSYLRSELTKLQLTAFYDNITDVLDVWFNGHTPGSKSNLITKHIFESGAYGTNEFKALAILLKSGKTGDSAKKKRRKAITRLLFLPCRQMAVRYPVLNKFPFLLPVFWMIRGVDTVLFHRDKIAKQKKRLNALTPVNIDQYRRELHDVGLNFNFEE
ncbi:MAG TPA: nucleotidyltransferase family protein [Oscillospiraceae bacterium]|nr:nucleotidyltransferase family protein [Oscillospiraceae bacterium]HPF54942.1 nucleotidyltransferase family protein [Clostridiales bacterium]HPK35001.1 nucleotidyltransferase family protein [Oscillospiraceae bacterium]HPR75559.1 nucleotidyltransferase family protein [Oscillospiraceae bacterium]